MSIRTEIITREAYRRRHDYPVWHTADESTAVLRLSAFYDWGTAPSVTRVTVPAPRDALDLPRWWDEVVKPQFGRMIDHCTYVATVTGCLAWRDLGGAEVSWRRD